MQFRTQGKSSPSLSQQPQPDNDSIDQGRLKTRERDCVSSCSKPYVVELRLHLASKSALSTTKPKVVIRHTLKDGVIMLCEFKERRMIGQDKQEEEEKERRLSP